MTHPSRRNRPMCKRRTKPTCKPGYRRKISVAYSKKAQERKKAQLESISGRTGEKAQEVLTTSQKNHKYLSRHGNKGEVAIFLNMVGVRSDIDLGSQRLVDAIKKYQKENGLSQDGFVNPRYTKKGSLFQHAISRGPKNEAQRKNLKYLTRYKNKEEISKFLKKLGLPSDTQYASKNLESAIRTYQKENELPEDGFVNPNYTGPKSLFQHILKSKETKTETEASFDTPPNASNFLETDYEPLKNWLDDKFAVTYEDFTVKDILENKVPLNDIHYVLADLPEIEETYNCNYQSISRRELLKALSTHFNLEMSYKLSEDGMSPSAIIVTKKD